MNNKIIKIWRFLLASLKVRRYQRLPFRYLQKGLLVGLVFVLIAGWIFSGWPQIWQNPQIPPKIQEAQAAISLKTAGTWVRIVTDPSSVTIPGTPVAGDRMFLFVTWKTYTITVADPSGWTPIGTEFADGTSAASNGRGSVKVMAWYRDWQTGDSNPSVDWSVAPTEGHAVIMLWQKGAGETWDTPLTVTGGMDNWTTTSQTFSASSTVAVPNNSVVMGLVGIRDNSTVMTRPTTGIDAASGITWNGNYIESPATHFSSTTGLDMSGDLGYRFVTTGATATLSMTGTISAAETGAGKWVVQGFTPTATAPTVTSPTATSIGSNDATLGANVTSDGGASITARGTCWGTSAAPTTNCLAEGGTATGIFTHIRTGMPLSTLIYYRGYTTNSIGTGYSADGTFTTDGAPGWLTGYSHRAKITVNGVDSGHIGYQMKVKVYSGAGTNTTEDAGKTAVIYCNSNSLNWPDDIAFTEDDEVTEIYHWREDDVSPVTFWIKVDVPASGNTTDYYIYYGKSGGSSAYNSGTSTFEEFLDKDSTTGWTHVGGNTITTSGDFLRSYGSTFGTVQYSYRTDWSSPAVWALEARFKNVSLGTADVGFIMSLDGGTANRFTQVGHPKWDDQDSVYFLDNGAVWTEIGSNIWTEGTEFISVARVDESDDTTGVDLLIYDTSRNLLASTLNEEFALGLPTDMDGICVGNNSSVGYEDVYFRWIFLRKYASTEPIFSSAGGEMSTAIEIRAQNYSTAVSSITFPEAEPGATVSNPSNSESETQTFGGAGVAKPVVTLYNSSASPLTIWYNITTFTNSVVSNEYYLINDNGAACADETAINNNATFDADTVSAGSTTIAAGTTKDLYLKLDLGSVAGKTGTSTLTILGET